MFSMTDLLSEVDKWRKLSRISSILIFGKYEGLVRWH